MRGNWSPALALCFLASVARAGEHPVEVGAVLEGRVTHADASTSWLDGGLGKTREGGDGSTTASLSHAAFLLDVQATPTLSLHAQGNVDAHAHHQLARVGVVEAFAAWKPDVRPWFLLRTRLGLFFPPVSLEHRGEGWTTTHTLTPSAVNAWIGEEVRTLGLETRFVFVTHDHEISLLGAVFDANDPAGTLLHWRGWALHDRQTSYRDRLPLPPLPSLSPGGIFFRQAPWTQPIARVDDHAGWYAGLSWRQSGRFEVSALRWDNRGDPAVFDGKQYAWYTEFDSYAARLRLPLGLELLGQRMTGETEMGLFGGEVFAQSEFKASYGMLSGKWGRVRLSVRRDTFEVEGVDAYVIEDDNDEDGDAWTAAAVIDVARGHQVFVEWLRVESDRPARADVGLPVHARDEMLQAALRLRF